RSRHHGLDRRDHQRQVLQGGVAQGAAQHLQGHRHPGRVRDRAARRQRARPHPGRAGPPGRFGPGPPLERTAPVSAAPLPLPLALDFAAPGRLWLLAAAAGLAVAYLVMQLRRRRDAAKFAAPALLPLLVPGRAPWWRHAVALVFAAGLVLATVAAAQPTVPGT